MFSFEEEAGLMQDREDLIEVLRMRFGSISPDIIESIYEISQLEKIERLILVAANTPELEMVLEEMQEGAGSFRITGNRFNPIDVSNNGGL
ncbi:hypothetical protein NC797_17640 [Aquibacillus sp. 3ASR75-11]|uniref:Uncharacterized protein n=1 Tax=Terrihalobacillus insolitus TaxID=2950438 RepID=A0A9X4ANA4_9BACI|nr:hypothetical protein [Terrihalobacillus insolitus]MDC3413513.1 hypothetical protein [Terrihalobacillus insolitus]MDC3426307.1 hypothetical protein [Terrihalobacillus insolitus]